MRSQEEKVIEHLRRKVAELEQENSLIKQRLRIAKDEIKTLTKEHSDNSPFAGLIARVRREGSVEVPVTSLPLGFNVRDARFRVALAMREAVLVEFSDPERVVLMANA